jgi:hypothetical protein
LSRAVSPHGRAVAALEKAAAAARPSAADCVRITFSSTIFLTEPYPHYWLD